MTNTHMAHVLAATLVLLYAMVAADAASLPVSELGKCRGERQCRVLNATELGKLRGGYTFMTTGGPVELNFGIVRVVYINNELVALTQLVLPDVMKSIAGGTLSAAQIQSLNSVLSGAAAPIVPATTNAASNGAA